MGTRLDYFEFHTLTATSKTPCISMVGTLRRPLVGVPSHTEEFLSMYDRSAEYTHWAIENCEGCFFVASYLIFYFEKSSDAMLFKLRWVP